MPSHSFASISSLPLFLYSICLTLPHPPPTPTQRTCSTVWISTHYRLRAIYDDEKPDIVRGYNLGMREYFDRGARCGPVNYVDVYNMTAALASEAHHEATKMTYDMVHWGIEANLHKAQIVLNALVKMQ